MLPGAVSSTLHVGGCQNHGPFLGTQNIRCRIMIGMQKGTIILTTSYVRYDSMRSRIEARAPMFSIARHRCRVLHVKKLPSLLEAA